VAAPRWGYRDFVFDLRNKNLRGGMASALILVAYRGGPVQAVADSARVCYFGLELIF